MDKLKPPSEKDENPLWNQILSFKKKKLGWAVVLLLVALSGLIIPIIPGTLILILVIALYKKGWMAKWRQRFRLWRIEKE